MTRSIERFRLAVGWGLSDKIGCVACREPCIVATRCRLSEKMTLQQGDGPLAYLQLWRIAHVVGIASFNAGIVNLPRKLVLAQESSNLAEAKIALWRQTRVSKSEAYKHTHTHRQSVCA